MKLLEKNYVKYALILCGVIIACLIYTQVTGAKNFDKSPILAFLLFIAPIVVWFLGIRAKKRSQKNKLTFKQGCAEGFKMSLTYAILSPIIFLLYYLFVNPAMVTSIQQAYHITHTSFAFIVTVDLSVQFFTSLIFGTLTGAIISFFLKSK